MRRAAAALGLVLSWSLSAGADEPTSGREPIQLASDLALSPDGGTLVFSWAGDLWSVPSSGGAARSLTRNSANDRSPSFSPDGKSLAFVSDRQGSDHTYVIPSDGGVPRQVGFHSAGYLVQGWTPDGRSLLVSGRRDHHWRDAARFFLIPTESRGAETLVFDAAGVAGSLSPDGHKLLFTREGAPWFRKGYVGSQDSQIWMYDLEARSFTKVLATPGGALWPLWRPDGKGFYYVGIHKGSLNLREHDLGTGKDQALTEFDDDSVVYPAISRDGSTIVFRRLFDLYRFRPGKDTAPTRLEIWNAGDPIRDRNERRTLSQASQAAFTRDGLEIAFVAGGDLWVMDTELREPRQVTATPEEERDPVFSPDGTALYFVSDRDGQSDIWKGSRGDAGKDWWQNETFKLDRVTQDAEVEGKLQWSPEGSKIAFVKGRGDLWVMNADGKDPRRMFASWSRPQFDWSPDGKWMVYTVSDQDFNEDVWVAPVDGSRPPVNISKHPDNESDPVWSPDGKLIAFTGRRFDREVDVFFVWLRAEDDEKSSRERTVEKAAEKIKQARKKNASAAAKGAEDKKAEKSDGEPKSPAAVAIDFDRIHERLRRIVVPDSTESGLFWSPDSKKLAFTATIQGKAGVYTVEIPADLEPKLLSASIGSDPRWLDTGNQVVWVIGGVPSSLTAAGKASSYTFRAPQRVDVSARHRAAFEMCWRLMRDQWYDERLGNRNWDAIRRKYSDAAASAPDPTALATVVNLMLGELNGSHLGFTAGSGGRTGGPRRGPMPTTPASPGEAPSRWTEVTAHLGLRFDPQFKGPGLKVRDVLPTSPTDRRATRVQPGEVVLAIDGTTVDPAFDLTRVLNGRLDRDLRLTVQDKDGKSREVTLRPISYETASAQLYEKWINDNRRRVEDLSKGSLGYLHIRGMDFSSFYRFEEELYSAGAGKSGLIIDVRENGGGSTADHLLTALTQPVHAITVPRGGGPGYPQDRKVYATWSKPIVVLCNQNSFSNAEIFSHAIKTLKRGKLVGVPTAGGVISTGGTSIMDVGFLRLPTRGWFLPGTGEDMELNGAVPDHVVWPEPADFAKWIDTQLVKAVQVLLADVVEAEQAPKPRLRKATERPPLGRSSP
ncbi:MAG: S41 family peptidase [Isosphaeraceae bacterium]